MTGQEVVVLAWCEDAWCGEPYDMREGWAGRCPSCLALADEHVAGAHVVHVEACAHCRRNPSPPPSPYAEAAGSRGRAG